MRKEKMGAIMETRKLGIHMKSYLRKSPYKKYGCRKKR
jgi:hypothetical protein